LVAVGIYKTLHQKYCKDKKELKKIISDDEQQRFIIWGARPAQLLKIPIPFFVYYLLYKISIKF
tara:strand:+ start:278 stop:469 length:192 start_codon:yes stop_codon:yes gene_type:complete